METPQTPSIITEHHWLAKGLQDNHIRHETGVKIMILLDSLPDSYGKET